MSDDSTEDPDFWAVEQHGRRSAVILVGVGVAMMLVGGIWLVMYLLGGL